MYLPAQNLASRTQQGIDYLFQYRQPLDVGVLRWQWAGTMNIRSRYTDKLLGRTVSDLGNYAGETGRFIPRHKWAISASYDPKPTQRHRLTLNYTSGNTEPAMNATTRQVPALWTLDWRTDFSPSPGVSLGLGINNITNRIPVSRFTTSQQGAASIDTRYGDFRGRTLTLSLDAKF